jgi:hypothetical protein
MNLCFGPLFFTVLQSSGRLVMFYIIYIKATLLRNHHESKQNANSGKHRHQTGLKYGMGMNLGAMIVMEGLLSCCS